MTLDLDSLRFDAVIFDLDGLLLDTERVGMEAGIEALASLGHSVDDEIMRSLIGLDGPAGLARLSAHLGVTLDPQATMSAWRQAMETRMTAGVPTMAHATELLDRLHALGLPNAVATNSRTQGALTKIEASALAGRFEVVVGFDLVAAGKPAPDVYLEAARRLGINPARVLVFEDSDVGTRAGLAAGMTVVQVPDQLPSRENAAHFTAETLHLGADWAGLWPARG
ncbi:hypothetical protein LCGC14_1587950 [marine sediment metagenome]|uniref:FCP1 homology domain-containing protein n=1 Tax=marine sediment metagenome TaxID=412755 RepID=A0A0F9J118_9ZZZZ